MEDLINIMKAEPKFMLAAFCICFLFFGVSVLFFVKVVLAIIETPRQLERLPDRLARQIIVIQREEEQRKQTKHHTEQHPTAPDA
jgi:hypothetical protein